MSLGPCVFCLDPTLLFKPPPELSHTWDWDQTDLTGALSSSIFRDPGSVEDPEEDPDVFDLICSYGKHFNSWIESSVKDVHNLYGIIFIFLPLQIPALVFLLGDVYRCQCSLY